MVYLIAVLKNFGTASLRPIINCAIAASNTRGPLRWRTFATGWGRAVRFTLHLCGGQLDLINAGPMSRGRTLRLLPGLIRGTHIVHADVQHEEVREFRLVADVPVPGHLADENQPLQTVCAAQSLPGARAIM